MDSSRRAVESYWRSRMIDAVTSDEDKVAPVYKLEEICELLRSSHVSIVKEVSEFVLKRLDHKSPIVKQKALRLIKYAVGKSGAEFRREMQRNSVAVRQLLHYKGQPDPLKGDALNKAVRDTANDTISAMFSAEDNKPAPSENLARRIEGFGNTNFSIPPDDKKSFLSEVVGIGSASIKQGINSFAQANSARKDDNGSYKSPNLRRSLTTEIDYPVRGEYHNDNHGSFDSSKNVSGGTWGQDVRVSNVQSANADSSSTLSESKTREQRLLETIVTSGGVRLQPTRDAIHVFLVEAAKLDPLPLCHAIESKLQSHMWQVRVKASCVLESILRKNDVENFEIVASYFSENRDVVVKCSESPQASLRERANKVLGLLGGGHIDSASSHTEKPMKPEASMVVQLPDLIDTADSDDLYAAETTKMQHEERVSDLVAPNPPVLDDLFGDGLCSSVSTSEQKIDDDPFADVSFHNGEARQQPDDLFSGMTVDDKPSNDDNRTEKSKSGTELFDIFGPNPELLQAQENHKNVSDIMAGLSINEGKEKTTSLDVLSEKIFSSAIAQPSNQVSSDAAIGSLGSQTAGLNPNLMLPLGSMPYNINPSLMFNPALLSQPINYGAMGNFLAQQQLLAAMPNFQQLGSMGNHGVGVGHAVGAEEGYTSALPDIFNPNVPATTSTVLSSSKKEDTKAFDFISDHLAAARDPRRVV